MIRQGVTDLRQPYNKDQMISIENIFVHPKYNGRAYFDIAVLQTAPLVFQSHRKPVCLPDSSDFKIDKYENYASTLIGWGSKDLTGLTSDTLKRTILTIHEYR